MTPTRKGTDAARTAGRLVALALTVASTARAGELARPILEPGTPPGTASAVVVDARASLVHTGQVLPLDGSGAVTASDDATRQGSVILDRLDAALRRAGSGLDRLVKLNVSAAGPDDLAAFRKLLARRLEGRSVPAFAAVIGALPASGARLAVDAVSVGPEAPAGGAVRVLTPEPSGHGVASAVLPAGAKVYVSGQADPGEDLAAATSRTMRGLDASLRHAGTEPASVVQVRAFVQPMTPESAETVRAAVARHFAPSPSPPLVLVAWKSSPGQPIEIELVAAAPEGSKEAVAFLTPPALKASPVFSRVARIGRGDVIYVSELFGAEGATGPAQVEAVFARLSTTLGRAGSDLRHLVKATYFVSDDAASRALNDLRPKYYDPSRPPAASKAMVAGVGAPGRTVSLDMIAVPAGLRRTPE